MVVEGRNYIESGSEVRSSTEMTADGRNYIESESEVRSSTEIEEHRREFGAVQR